MSNLQGNGSTNEYNNHQVPPAKATNTWMVPMIAAAVIVVLGLGYVYQGSWMGSSTTNNGSAPVTRSITPAAPEATPMAPKP